uniref:Uncharacterized protein n=1 Tax=Oryza glumipatula TaxID=40148 RepID=A0A0E0AQS1_9ORYZ
MARMRWAVEAVDRAVRIERGAREQLRGVVKVGQQGAEAASAALPPSTSGQGVEAGRRCPEGKKEKGAVERRARPFRFWEERGREHELCLAALDARGVGRRAREDDAGDDCKKDGDCLEVSTDTRWSSEQATTEGGDGISQTVGHARERAGNGGQIQTAASVSVGVTNQD